MFVDVPYKIRQPARNCLVRFHVFLCEGCRTGEGRTRIPKLVLVSTYCIVHSINQLCSCSYEPTTAGRTPRSRLGPSTRLPSTRFYPQSVPDRRVRRVLVRLLALLPKLARCSLCGQLWPRGEWKAVGGGCRPGCCSEEVGTELVWRVGVETEYGGLALSSAQIRHPRRAIRCSMVGGPRESAGNCLWRRINQALGFGPECTKACPCYRKDVVSYLCF